MLVAWHLLKARYSDLGRQSIIRGPGGEQRPENLEFALLPVKTEELEELAHESEPESIAVGMCGASVFSRLQPVLPRCTIRTKPLPRPVSCGIRPISAFSQGLT